MAAAGNRAPTLALAATPASAPEGGAVTASGTWSDADGDVVTLTASTGAVTRGVGTWSWTATRGDDLTLPVTVTATDAVGATRSLALTARWTNVAPAATLATTGRDGLERRDGVVRAGGHAGDVPGAARPTPAATTSRRHGPSATAGGPSPARCCDRRARDALPSPSVEPRALTSSATHTWPRACSHTLRVRATDDDGGASPTRGRTVVVLGTSTVPRSLAWWQAEYRGLTSSLTSAERACLLSTARTLSTVFAEQRALSTTADAVAVLRPSAPATPRATLDAELLTVWLDVATGAVPLAKPLDADGNGTTDTTVGAFLLTTEATRTASSATSPALAPLTTVLRRISATS